MEYSVFGCVLLFSSQVVPKPMTSAAQVVSSSQTQQRLIMPAAPLPQIQPNLTNLPPGTVLAPASGSGNMGYAVLPAQYVTQVCVRCTQHGGDDTDTWLMESCADIGLCL